MSISIVRRKDRRTTMNNIQWKFPRIYATLSTDKIFGRFLIMLSPRRREDMHE